MSVLPSDPCYQDQLGWLEGGDLETLREHWPWGRVWSGDISAADDKRRLKRWIADSPFASYDEYQRSNPAKKRFAQIFRNHPQNYKCWVCEVHPVEGDLVREISQPNYGLDTHHLNYSRLGQEDARHLIKLCRTHHEKVGELERKSRGVQCLSWYVAFLRWQVAAERSGLPVVTGNEPMEPLPPEFVEQQARLH